MPSETPSDRFRRHFPIPPPPFQTAFSVRPRRFGGRFKYPVIPAQAGI
ncbi:TPA: hypothetical protein ACFRG8_000914 [Neisseria lactamica]|nr:hypothetical protein [Neisseria lactamica]